MSYWLYAWSTIAPNVAAMSRTTAPLAGVTRYLDKELDCGKAIILPHLQWIPVLDI
jgi:hypothetical protein